MPIIPMCICIYVGMSPIPETDVISCGIDIPGTDGNNVGHGYSYYLSILLVIFLFIFSIIGIVYGVSDIKLWNSYKEEDDCGKKRRLEENEQSCEIEEDEQSCE
uniref:Uncharacterized protein n=1 Tax=Acrobeloides nanus TaxID=290746 RepID=A0A914BWK0_9BILA